MRTERIMTEERKQEGNLNKKDFQGIKDLELVKS